MGERPEIAGGVSNEGANADDQFLNPGAQTGGMGNAGADNPPDQAEVDAAMAKDKVQAGTQRDIEHITEQDAAGSLDPASIRASS